jgi:phosphate/sulfate permease
VAASDKMPPTWVIWSCYLAIGLGTMFGGWRIVKTMGQRITKLKPVGGFCAETGGAMTLFLATGAGHPGVDHAHHHRRDRRRRRRLGAATSWALGGA